MESDPEAEFALEIWIISTILYLAVHASVCVLLILLLVEVFKVFAQDRAHLHHSHLQLVFMKSQMSLVKGFFRTFPRPEKSAKVTRHSSARVLRSVSSSELNAHGSYRPAPGIL